MILSRRVSLNDVQLDSLDERIIISGFEEDEPNENFRTAELYFTAGSRVTNRHLNPKKIIVKFMLKVRKGNFADRNTILEKITGWANGGGTLKSTTRPNRQITVTGTQKPKISDPRKWESEYQMTFEAIEKPFWEETTATSKTMAQDDEGEDTITMGGNTWTVGEALIQNKSGGTLDTLSLTVNGYQMSFTNLGLTNNAYLTIDHLQTGGIFVKRARIGQASVLDKLTGADEFILNPGSNAISYTAGGDVIVQVSAKGRYL